MIMKIYRALLWFFGFARGEYITFMLRRQEARLGVWWWLLVFATQGSGIVLSDLFLHLPWSLVVTLGLTIIVGVLAWHVDNAKIPDETTIEALYAIKKPH